MGDSSWWTAISAVELLGLRRRLLAYVRAEFGSAIKAEVEDVAQDALVILFRHRENVRADNDGLYRYMRTVSRHVALDRIKAAKRRQQHLIKSGGKCHGRASKPPASGTSPEELAEQNKEIWKIFCALDDLDRLVIWSHVVDGKSIRAVSRELGLNWHRVAGIIEGTLRGVRRQLTP